MCMDIFSKKREGHAIIDMDTILSEKDKILVDESFKHEKEGKLVPISEFKEQLDL